MKVLVMVSNQGLSDGGTGSSVTWLNPGLCGGPMGWWIPELVGGRLPRGVLHRPVPRWGRARLGILGQGQKDPGTQRPGLAVSARSHGRWDV